ncbi:MAG: hypothetical protein M3N38_03315 [Pseudomonadota bacterium]|nr:hypothetical protein [Pseudomonadota bacterium]
MVRQAVAAGLAVLILVGLGVWQLDRHELKVARLADLAAALDGSAEPLSLTGAEAALAGEGSDHVLVRTAGVFLHGEERYLFAARHGQPGWRVLTPLVTDSDHRLLFVDRGFVPASLRAPVARPGSTPEGSQTVQGLLRPARAKAMFEPANEPRNNVWYWPDVPALLASLSGETGRSASPHLLVALPDETAVDHLWPMPERPDVARIPNHHRGYAFTWFALAAALAAVAIGFFRSRYAPASHGFPP